MHLKNPPSKNSGTEKGGTVDNKTKHQLLASSLWVKTTGEPGAVRWEEPRTVHGVATATDRGPFAVLLQQICSCRLRDEVLKDVV